ncbi:MAG: hypothetical protein EPN93_08490 [Spirochaetes bacterium]|nr:MAG: hypothetical protein EPN93_08490 [Spirochaetota bacterium]
MTGQINGNVEYKKNDFIDFIVSISKNEIEESYKNIKKLESLTKEGDAQKLCDWFSELGYVVKIEDCERLIKSGESIGNYKDVLRFNGGY